MPDYCEDDYYAKVSVITADLVDAMKHRMVRCGDWRPLFVYVSVIDGTHTIGCDGEHEEMWRMPVPVTASMQYSRIAMHVAEHCRRAPLYPQPLPGIV